MAQRYTGFFFRLVMMSIVLGVDLHSSLLLQSQPTHQSLCWSSLCLQEKGHSNHFRQGAASSYFHHLFRCKDCGHSWVYIQKSTRPRLQDWVLAPSLSLTCWWPRSSHFPLWPSSVSAVKWETKFWPFLYGQWRAMQFQVRLGWLDLLQELLTQEVVVDAV